MNNEPQQKRGNGLGMILIIIIVAVLAIFFFKNDTVSVEPIPGDGMNQAEVENLDTMEDQDELSTEDDIDTIDTELDATSFSELEADLEAFDF